jgi:hypothetical protein
MESVTGCFFYFDIYSSPKEVGEHVLRSYEESEALDENDFLKDVGFTYIEWRSMVSNLTESEFMSRKFMDILNNHIRNVS